MLLKRFIQCLMIIKEILFVKMYGKEKTPV